MKEKLNMKDFFESLAIRHGMSRGNAESFVKDFFNQVEDSLSKGQSVKIDGFGVFEQTKENNQISFIPDGPLKDMGLQLDLFEQPATEEPNNDESELEVVAEQENVNESQPVSNTEVTKAETIEEPIQKPIEETQEQNPEPVHLSSSYYKEEPEKDDNKGLKIFSYIALAIMLVCVAVVAYFYIPAFHQVKDSPVIEPLEQETSEVEGELEVTDVQNDKPENAVEPAGQASQAEKAPAATPSEKVPLDPKKKYDIAGTMNEYTVERGETLSDISLKFYGNRNFWTYIVTHNASVIKNPDNVPFGTKIQIPQLKER